MCYMTLRLSPLMADPQYVKENVHNGLEHFILKKIPPTALMHHVDKAIVKMNFNICLDRLVVEQLTSYLEVYALVS